MGRLLGSHADDDELDRPDLNKCPDCGCYFAQMKCPFCGKICPEEFRAGNRKAVKKKKQKTTGSGRSYFVEWYHSWWAIGLALLFAPILGIVLLVTSPHKKSLKIGIAVVAVVYGILSTFGLGNIITNITGILDKPVDTSLSREEYLAACETVTPEEYYRSAEGYTDRFVSVTLTVSEKITDSEGVYSGGKYNTYYICRDAEGRFEIMVRDCVQENGKKFISGDVITVYGEGAGENTIYDDYYYAYTAPCIHAAYMELQ